MGELIKQENAEAYKAKNGHYPLVIGLEYLYLDQFVILKEAHCFTDDPMVCVHTRFGESAHVRASELGWKGERKKTNKSLPEQGNLDLL